MPGPLLAALPYILAAAGTGLTAVVQDNARKKQDRALFNNLQEQGRYQREADSAINTKLHDLQNSTPEEERAQAADAFLSQLRLSRRQGEASEAPGYGSQRYQDDKAAAGQQVVNFGNHAANVLARITAPTLQRENEGVASNRLRRNLSTIGRNAAGSDFLNQLRLKRIKPDPWAMAAGQGLTSAGMAMAANGFGTPKPDPAIVVDTSFIDPYTAVDSNLTGVTRGLG